MATIRFEISDELNRKLMKIKGNTLKIPYAQELFKKAVEQEEKQQQKKK